MKQVPERKSSLEYKPRSFDLSTFAPCQAVTHSLLQAIATMTQVRAQVIFLVHVDVTWASGYIPHERYQAAVSECCFVDGDKEGSIFLSNGIDYDER